MIYHHAPIPSKNIGGKQTKNPKSGKYPAVPSEQKRTNDIDRLNLGKPANDSKNDSESEKKIEPAND